MPTFTMKEFVRQHRLKADIRNPAQSRMIAQKLRSKGYTRVKMRVEGKVTNVWTNECTSEKEKESLKSQLASLKL